MHDDLRAALIASTRRVFHTLFGIDIDTPARRAIVPEVSGADVTAEVDVWGDVEGAVTIRMRPAMVQRVTAMMTGAQSTEIDERAMDVVGELASMITEGAMGRLGGVKFSASSPTIRLLAGADANDQHEPQAIRIRCGCECGELTIDASMRAFPSSSGGVRHAAPANVTGVH